MKKLMVLFSLTLGAIVFSVVASYAEDPPPFILKWGKQGTGPGEFSTPRGIGVDISGNVFVCDETRVQKFTSHGGFLLQWDASDSRVFRSIVDTATDPQGNVYVVDQNDNRVKKFDNKGTFLTMWGGTSSGDGELWLPTDIAIDPNGYVYVYDGGLNRIKKFTYDGSFVTGWTPIHQVSALAVAPNGDVYAAEGWADPGPQASVHIARYSSIGGFLGSFASVGPDSGLSGYPGIIVDAQGNLFLIDRTNHRIQKFRSDGQVLSEWGSLGNGDGQFYGPIDIDLDGNGNVYVVEYNNNRVQKFGPGGPTGPGGLRPVVLVHGICSDADSWSNFEQGLRDNGFQVYSLSLTPNNFRPQDLVGTLDLFVQIGMPLYSKVNVIAHSMGGVVTREYIRRRLGSHDHRVGKLITLGTPHHGSDVAAKISSVPGLRTTLRILTANAFCPLETHAFNELLPGSDFLNGLNYGDDKIKWDRAARKGGRSWDSHEPEIYDPDVQYFSFGGSGSLCPYFAVLLGVAWTSPGPTYHFNDGVVSVEATKLLHPGAKNYTDFLSGLPPLDHSKGPPGLFCGDGYTESTQLRTVIENILRGGTPPPPTKPNSSAAVSQLTAVTDTVEAYLLSPAGTLQVGQAIEYSVVVPPTAELQVHLGATGGAHLTLRTPDAIWITPADTATISGLQFVQESSLGFEGFIYKNPPPGTWAIRVDGSSSLQPQEFGTVARVTSVESILLDISPPVVVSSSDSVNLQARVDSSGVVIFGTTWDVTITRPDSTTFPIMLYDDGAHGDSLDNDGVFGAFIHPSDQVGFYQIEVHGTIPSDGMTIVSGTSFELATFQDLETVPGSILVDRNPIQAGDTVQVSAQVRNLGTDAVPTVTVEFWDDSTHVKFGTVTVSLNGGETKTVQALWVADSTSRHLLRVTVDPFALPMEANYANNSDTMAVVLGQGIVGVEVPTYAIRKIP